MLNVAASAKELLLPQTTDERFTAQIERERLYNQPSQCSILSALMFKSCLQANK